MERWGSRSRGRPLGTLRLAPSLTAGFVFDSLDSFDSSPQIGLEVTGRSKGRMSNTLVEGCSVGIDVASGARVDISSGSRSQILSRCIMQHYI